MKNRTLALAALAAALAACAKSGGKPGERVLEYGAVAVAGTSDPNQVASMYDADLTGLVYEALYDYDYLARPFRVLPALADGMPEVSKDRRTYTIKLKTGIFYPDDACFAEGKGREFVAKDFVHAMYRKADPKSKSQTWWLVDGQFAGLDALRAAAQGGKDFDYDAVIEDLKAVDAHTVKFTLKRPFPQIMWVLAKEAMSPYPLECARHYGEDFANHPVGLGPFRMEAWEKNARYTLVRNENYREALYPSEGEASDKAAGRLADAGRRLPFADKVVVHEYSQSQPYWLQFRAGKFAFGRVPGEFTDEVFKLKTKEGNKKIWERDAAGNRLLSDEYAKKYSYYPLPLLDLIYRGFNFEDPVVGGLGGGKKIRQALSLAHDINEENNLFYNGLNIVYAGIIPPGVQGFDPDLKSPYHGPDLERAKKLLAEAGYPEGKGLPELQECGSEDARTVEQTAFFIKNAEKIGVKIRFEAMRFAELSKKLKEKRCQIMGLAWGGDWPDAQNFVQLAYGPNKSPGSNNYNYDVPEVNKLYEQALPMPPSPERDVLYRKINARILEDQPFHGSMARTRDYLIPPDTLNFKPEEMLSNHAKYIRLKSWGEPDTWGKQAQ
jgi:ABC-type transport system substrate-binding protein